MAMTAIQTRAKGAKTSVRPPAGLLAARAFAAQREPAGNEHGQAGKLPAGASFSFGRLALQAKLTVGSPNDPLEREADQMSEHVIGMPVPAPRLTSAPARVSRECAACEADTAAMTLSPRLAGAPKRTGEAPGIVHDVVRSSGRPLDPAARGFMEPRFRRDFGDVRIHSDTLAAESARAIGAHAYTVGADVVFDSGRYNPGDDAGRRLLAHELTHVVQQGEQSQGPGIPPGQFIRRDTDDNALDDPTAMASEADDDPSEVHDGDSPVDASSGAAPEAGSQAPADMVAAAGGGEGGQAAPAQATPAAPAQQPSTPAPSTPGPSTPGPSTPAPSKPAAARKITAIDVDQSTQSMTVTWSDGTTETHPVSTGKGVANTKDDPCKTQTEENCTPNGTFTVGRRGDGSTANSHGDAMHWYVGFVDSRGIGIHNSQPVPGSPASHGCVRVGIGDAAEKLAEKINKNVTPGTTTVTVHGKAATHPYSKPKPKPKPKP